MVYLCEKDNLNQSKFGALLPVPATVYVLVPLFMGVVNGLATACQRVLVGDCEALHAGW
jgi:hypothetical protein